MPSKAQDPSSHGVIQFPSPSAYGLLGGLAAVSSDRRWFVVHSKPRQERVALVNLERQGYESYLPLFAVQKMVQRKLEVVREPMFSRYLFVRIDPNVFGQSRTQIRSTLGVSTLVRFGDQSAQVDDALIAHIRQRESLQNDEPLSLFAPGEKVRVSEGSLAGVEAVYHARDGESRAAILLEILCCRVTMVFNISSLRKLK